MAIAVDAQGDAYIAGDTESSDFPVTPGAAQTKFGGLVSAFGVGSFGDGFVAKLNPTGSTFLFATYWGGSAPDVAYAIAVDSAGNAYVAGGTSSSDFPVTAGAFQTTYAGPPDNPDAPDPAGDAFVSKFSPLGAVVWSTYLGGSLSDVAYAIALDGSGNVYIAGVTESSDFPKSGAFIPTCRATGGPFVAELDPTGAKLLHSTGMSGLGYDYALALAVSSTGTAYIAGGTESQVFFSTPGAAQTTYAGAAGSYQAFAAGIDFSAQSGTYAACVLNAASFAAGNAAPFPLGTVAPGEIVSLFGSGLGPGAPAVTFDGIPAPVLYAGANQINAVVPYGVGSTFDADDCPIQRTILRPYRYAGGRGRSRHLHARWFRPRPSCGTQSGRNIEFDLEPSRARFHHYVLRVRRRSDDARGCRRKRFAADTAAANAGSARIGSDSRRDFDGAIRGRGAWLRFGIAADQRASADQHRLWKPGSAYAEPGIIRKSVGYYDCFEIACSASARAPSTPAREPRPGAAISHA